MRCFCVRSLLEKPGLTPGLFCLTQAPRNRRHYAEAECLGGVEVDHELDSLARGWRPCIATLWRVESLLRQRSDRPKLANGSHLTLRFTADVFPRFSSISYSICCPSLSVLSPARSTAEM